MLENLRLYQHSFYLKIEQIANEASTDGSETQDRLIKK